MFLFLSEWTPAILLYFQREAEEVSSPLPVLPPCLLLDAVLSWP